MRHLLFSLCVVALLLPGCKSWSKAEVAASWDSVERGAAIAKQHGLRFDAEVEIAERTHFGFIEALVLESPVAGSVHVWLDPAIAKDAPVADQPAVTEPTTQPVEDE